MLVVKHEWLDGSMRILLANALPLGELDCTGLAERAAGGDRGTVPACRNADARGTAKRPESAQAIN